MTSKLFMVIVENREIYIPTLYSTPPYEVTPSEFRKKCLDCVQLERLIYHALKKRDDMLRGFDTIPERDRQTDGQTDRQNCYIDIAMFPPGFVLW